MPFVPRESVMSDAWSVVERRCEEEEDVPPFR